MKIIKSKNYIRIEKKAQSIVLYHGTDYGGDDLQINNSETGEAIFLFDNGWSAEEYGRYIHEVSVNINNPFVFDAEGESWFNVSQRRIIDNAKRDGHDAVIFKNIRDGKYNSFISDSVYAVFNIGSINVLRTIDTVENPKWYLG